MIDGIFLNEEERIALHRLLTKLAHDEREDVIGLFTKNGVFHDLPGGADVALVRKLKESAGERARRLLSEYDGLLSDGRFDEADRRIAATDPETESVRCLLAVLTVTAAASGRLPSRARFFKAVEARIRRTSPDDADATLQGLAGEGN